MTTQYEDYLADWARVREGTKPAIIVERRKSADAYVKVICDVESGDTDDVRQLSVVYRPLADSAGNRCPAIIAGKPKAVDDILALLSSRAEYSRVEFQRIMGVLLGYSLEDCIEYTRSPLSQRCGCECCGGPTRASKLDDDARKARMTDFRGDRS